MQNSFQSGGPTNSLFLLLQVPARHKVKQDYRTGIETGGKQGVKDVDKWQHQKVDLITLGPNAGTGQSYLAACSIKCYVSR